MEYDDINRFWDNSAIPSLSEFIKIPNLTPVYDENWRDNKLLHYACEHMYKWVIRQNIKGLHCKLHLKPGRTPLLLLDFIPKNSDKTVVIYGHYDKQPPLSEDIWSDGLHPYIPVLKDNKLYGRGSVDDGYALYMATSIIKKLEDQNHPRIIVIIEGTEESGSIHLYDYINDIDIPDPDLIICLDSGGMDYDRLWITSSLRGILVGKLTVQVLTEGIHSGIGSGTIPSSYRILNQLLRRIEEPETGKMDVLDNLVTISENVFDSFKNIDVRLDKDVYPNVADIIPNNVCDLFINNGWRANLEVTGCSGIPDISKAGNVLRPYTSVILSIRLPPCISSDDAYNIVRDKLVNDVPYNAEASFDIIKKGSGWIMPCFSKKGYDIINNASQKHFNNNASRIPVGGSVPFMNIFAQIYPNAKFIVTGCVGPKSNPHGPDEFLHIDYAKKLNCCLYDIIKDMYC